MRQSLGLTIIAMANSVLVGNAYAGLSDRLPPSAYIDPIDQEIARTGKGIPGRPFPCAREKIEQGMIAIQSISTDKCVRMLPAQRWRGLWRNDFEGSQFCPAPAAACRYGSKGDRIWLTPRHLKGKEGALYSIDFIGRKTVYKGSYGHMGVSDHEIIVDRVTSARMVQAPPPAMTEAQLIMYWKRCEAAGMCIPSAEMRAKMNGRR